MKQIFFTAVGTWIIIAAAMGLTADSSSPDEEDPSPIVQVLNTAHLTERGAGIHLDMRGTPPALNRGESFRGADPDAPITVTGWIVECRPRDYRRRQGPFDENVSAYLNIENQAERTLTGMDVTLRFRNGSGYVMHEESVAGEMILPPGESGERIRFWHAANNEFATNDPYDIVSALAASGSLQIDIVIRKATFDDNAGG